ncbi:hypothetical protein H5410_046218 [Solanum commersonii]|uniref:Uncharacterized protein n=1 Tax=Solanum commersonii TaxID=4109 RepID=A0A9J5XFW5_SOLCO|nr:hypothetical protein H5410_046218 [Solanum commersonii]
MSTHSLGYQSSGFGFMTSLLGMPKTHGIKKTHFQLMEDELLSSSLHKTLSKRERKDFLTTLVDIANELGNLPFNQLIALSVLPSASSYSGSLGNIASRIGSKGGACKFGNSPSWTRRSAVFYSCSFQPFLLHFVSKCPFF